MSRRYDSRTTIFSPEGRLYQVEYALEAINHASIAIGVLAKDGIAIIAERKATSKLLDQEAVNEKLYTLGGNALCAVAGMTADANILINQIRVDNQNYLKVYNNDIPVASMVRNVCNLKQGYTQHGGLRPFGVSFLFAGYDDRLGFQLYSSNPSGNYSGWLATSVGGNNSNAQTILKQEYKDDLDLEGALKLALQVLSKTTDSAKLATEKIEVATISLHDGKVCQKIYTNPQIDALLTELDFIETDANAEAETATS